MKSTARIDFILQHKAVYEKILELPDITGSYISVYWALFHLNNGSMWSKEFTVDFGHVLALSKVDKTTYYKALDYLDSNGFFDLYEKGKSKYTKAKFSLKVLYEKSEGKSDSKTVGNKDSDSETSSYTESESASDSNSEHLIKPKNNKPLNIKTKETDKKSFIPPSLEEVRIYFHENGYPESIANKAFEMYNVNDWHDSKNNPVLNWKQKMISVWFKDENKISHERKNYGLGSTARVDPKRIDGRKAFEKL